MNHSNKRMNRMDGDPGAKRVKKQCSYGAACYRMNPAHLREYSHPHLEAILDSWSGSGSFHIPEQYLLQRSMITDQLNIIVEKKLYEPRAGALATTSQNQQDGSQDGSDLPQADTTQRTQAAGEGRAAHTQTTNNSDKSEPVNRSEANTCDKSAVMKTSDKSDELSAGSSNTERSLPPPAGGGAAARDPAYRPVVPPTRRAEQFLKVVRPRGLMAAKHEAAAPYYLFYTTITAAPETHDQPYSITFLELLDESLGELQSSLQINFMVEPGWLLAQYYFAGYSAKKLTILYGEECDDMRALSAKPHVDAVRVRMATPFGKHHTKMMLLCYEDGSLRVVVSTANLYQDDWDNRTQGLWLSPRLPALRDAAAAPAGDSATGFKADLLRYLAHYGLPQLAPYEQRVRRCDFSRVNVFLVASVPGTHADARWGAARAGALLRRHCAVPAADSRAWPLVAQASSLGSFGAEPQLWLCGEFLQQLTQSRFPPPPLTPPPPLQLVYPSLENVRQSHDGLLGGGCLPYSAAAHAKQRWLDAFLYQWSARRVGRSRAPPHVKSYLRARGRAAAYFLLTSANVSKAAWGAARRDGALRLLSYEAGVLLLPRLVINEDFFPLDEGAGGLVVPYDIPPVKYAAGMSAWVQDHLH